MPKTFYKFTVLFWFHGSHAKLIYSSPKVSSDFRPSSRGGLAFVIYLRMRAPSSLRHEFLKIWLKGLQIYRATKKEMSILDRKKAIKLSADVAMASTRVSTTCWSRALVANASKDATDKILVEHILGADSHQRLKKASMSMAICSKRIRSQKILRRSCTARRLKKAATNVVEASSLAKKLVKKRTQVLKSLVPGGEFLDEISLIRETLDYIVSLQVQVDVMRHLANATVQLEHSQDYE